MSSYLHLRCICGKETGVPFPLPTGWRTSDKYNLAEMEAFCPAHVPLAEWQQTQCHNCVLQWGKCCLFTDHPHPETLEAVLSGDCPEKLLPSSPLTKDLIATQTVSKLLHSILAEKT